MVIGAATILGASVRTTDGSVARDQARGFRRDPIETPLDASISEIAGYGAWAVALDCIDGWVQSLERLSVVQQVDVAESVPSLIRTSEPLTSWNQVGEFLSLLLNRLHADPKATIRNRRPVYVSWQDIRVE